MAKRGQDHWEWEISGSRHRKGKKSPQHLQALLWESGKARRALTTCRHDWQGTCAQSYNKWVQDGLMQTSRESKGGRLIKVNHNKVGGIQSHCGEIYAA
eukprot:1160479-Pelagomonas_calceolata.AAC.13